MKAICIVALLFAAPVWATKVYKCTGADGSVVFSQQPCSDDAEVVDTSAALKTGSGGSVQGVSDMAAMGKIDHECKMESLAVADRFAARRAGINREIQSTRASIGRTNNNLAGGNLRSGLENKIAQLQGTIQMINNEESAEQDRLRQRCEDRRREELERQRERDSKP